MSTRIANAHSVMRKAPRQARSHATVEALLQAGARILSDEGWSGFTTNKVADLAGVSIGSLYQYFTDKLSLVDAIRDRHLNDCLTALRDIEMRKLPPSQFVTELVHAMVAAHSIYPGLHRALLDEAPSAAEYRNPHSDFERKYLAHYANAVALYRNRAPNAADAAAALIISDAIDGVVHNAARRGNLADQAVQGALIRMLGLYLTDGADDGIRIA